MPDEASPVMQAVRGEASGPPAFPLEARYGGLRGGRRADRSPGGLGVARRLT